MKKNAFQIRVSDNIKYKINQQTTHSRRLAHEKFVHCRKIKYYTDLRKLKLPTDKSVVKKKTKKKKHSQNLKQRNELTQSRRKPCKKQRRERGEER